MRRVRFVDIDGVRIRTSVVGEGPPVLLVMGIGGNLEMWGPLERRLVAAGLSAVTYDAPGTGESGRWRRPRRMRAVADLAGEVLTTLGHPQADVLGVSLGGAVAQQLAHQAPERVRRLVLAATAPGLGGVPGDPRVLVALASRRRYRDPAYLREVAPRLYGGKARTAASLLEEGARLARPPSRAGYAAQLYAVWGWSSLRWLHRIPHETLVLAGDDDPIVPLVNARILARRIPRARLEVIRGGGHLFLLDSAEEAARTLIPFLSRPG